MTAPKSQWDDEQWMRDGENFAWASDPDDTITMTPAQVRKLARLTRLHAPDAVLKLEQWDEQEGAVHVEWLDQYGYRVVGRDGARKTGHAAVIRENGWSNPPVARMAAELASGGAA